MEQEARKHEPCELKNCPLCYLRANLAIQDKLEEMNASFSPTFVYIEK